MKNEILARAIGEIDDDLIADAHTVSGRVQLPLRRLCAMAACMLLFFGTLLYVRLPGDAIRFGGNALSDTPIVVQGAAPAVHTADPDMRDGNVLTVSLELSLRDATRIAAADGTFELLRGETALYTGNTYTTSGRLTLNWSVRTPNPTLTYRLTVGDTELLLSLDPATECWILTKS